jgi:hypothetical protein
MGPAVVARAKAPGDSRRSACDSLLIVSLAGSENGSRHDSARPGRALLFLLYQTRPRLLFASERGPSFEEFEVFTHQQLKAMRGHRYGKQSGETVRNRERHRENGSLHELLAALAAGLAGLGKRDREEVPSARPAY